MKKLFLIAGFLFVSVLIINPVYGQAKGASLSTQGGEKITLTDGTSVSGIITRFKDLKIYVATSRQGSTLIERGEQGPGVVVIKVSQVASIDWRGRNDDIKKRVDKAVSEYFSGESMYVKKYLFGNAEGNKTKFEMPDYDYTYSETTLKAKFGYGYTMWKERERDGYYIQGTTNFDYDKSLEEKKLSLQVGGVTNFEDVNQEEATESTGDTSGMSDIDWLGVATAFSNYAIGGYKYYMSGTPYFGFGEVQVGYDYRVASAEDTGNTLPDVRLYCGFGWGRVFNIAETTRAKTIEKELMNNNIISKPLSRPVQQEIENIFERSNNAGLQTQEVFQVLRNRGYINREPSLEQSFAVMQKIEDSFAYRLEGIEVKAGLLSHVVHQGDDLMTKDEEGTIDPTVDMAFYLKWYKPIGNAMQFQEEAILLQHVIPSPMSTMLFSNTTFDYKLSKELLMGAYNLLIYTKTSEPEITIFLDEIGGKLTYYIAEYVTVSAKLYRQAIGITYESMDITMEQTGMRVGFEYILL